MRKQLISKSKFLSLVLRHDPAVIGLILDQYGWADIDNLLINAQQHNIQITPEELTEIVETNEKKRFDLDVVKNRIRANQGHSIVVDLELTPTTPPEQLFHGSAVKNRKSILENGLIRGKRQYVHLSADIVTAKTVGSRRGSPIIFCVESRKMNQGGFLFYLSKNGVWLSEQVPSEYLHEIQI
jgi:putative RNA 2'-phosphotransferase